MTIRLSSYAALVAPLLELLILITSCVPSVAKDVPIGKSNEDKQELNKCKEQLANVRTMEQFKLFAIEKLEASRLEYRPVRLSETSLNECLQSNFAKENLSDLLVVFHMAQKNGQICGRYFQTLISYIRSELEGLTSGISKKPNKLLPLFHGFVRLLALQCKGSMLDKIHEIEQNEGFVNSVRLVYGLMAMLNWSKDQSQSMKCSYWDDKRPTLVLGEPVQGLSSVANLNEIVAVSEKIAENKEGPGSAQYNGDVELLVTADEIIEGIEERQLEQATGGPLKTWLNFDQFIYWKSLKRSCATIDHFMLPSVLPAIQYYKMSHIAWPNRASDQTLDEEIHNSKPLQLLLGVMQVCETLTLVKVSRRAPSKREAQASGGSLPRALIRFELGEIARGGIVNEKHCHHHQQQENLKLKPNERGDDHNNYLNNEEWWIPVKSATCKRYYKFASEADDRLFDANKFDLLSGIEEQGPKLEKKHLGAKLSFMWSKIFKRQNSDTINRMLTRDEAKERNKRCMKRDVVSRKFLEFLVEQIKSASGKI